MTRVCELCGKEFDGCRSSKYCSDECREARRKQYHAEYMRSYPRKKREKLVHIYTCNTCGKEFEGHGNRKYCSEWCAKQGYAKNHKDYNEIHREERREHIRELARQRREEERTRRGKVIKTCNYCGERFEITPLMSPNVKYCSDECREAAKKKKKGSQYYKPRTNKKNQPTRSLDSWLAEVDEYNEKHGTYLSYGQYKAKLYMEAHSKK